MRALNHAYDGAVAALVHEPYARRKGALDLWERQINSEKEGNPVWLGLSLTWSPDFYVTMLMFDVPKASRERDTCMEQRRLTETSVALARFKAERGQYPEGLASLVPAYLREVSMDVFSEAAPRYERLGNGYRLYSVGPDMRDDSGAGDDVSAVVEEGN